MKRRTMTGPYYCCGYTLKDDHALNEHNRIAHPVRTLMRTHPALKRPPRLPEPVNQAIIGFYASQTNATSEVSIFSGDDAKTMLKAYVLANELVGHIQKAAALIEELRRYRGEDGAYVPATRKAIDTGTLRPIPKRKNPPRFGATKTKAAIVQNLAKARKKVDRPGRNNPYSTPCEEGDD